MVKHFCDRCEKEIDFYHYTLTLYSENSSVVWKKELCNDCIKLYSNA